MTDPRDAYIAGLRELADFLEWHPDVPLPWHHTFPDGEWMPTFNIYLAKSDPVETLDVIAKAMGTYDRDDNGGVCIWRRFAGVALVARGLIDESTEDKSEVAA